MVKFHLSVNEAVRMAKALSPCMSSEETRYYLNGICLESSNEGLLAVACDGHRLGKLKLNPCDENMCERRAGDELPQFSVIIPKEAVKWLAALKPDKGLIGGGWVRFIVSPTDNGGSIEMSLVMGNKSAAFNLIDGAYPEWRRIVPEIAEQTSIAFNASYLKELCKAAHDAREFVSTRITQVRLFINDAHSPAVIESGHGLSYVLMPQRM